MLIQWDSFRGSGFRSQSFGLLSQQTDELSKASAGWYSPEPLETLPNGHLRLFLTFLLRQLPRVLAEGAGRVDGQQASGHRLFHLFSYAFSCH